MELIGPAAYMELYRRMAKPKQNPTQRMLDIGIKALTRAREMTNSSFPDIELFRAEVDLAFDACNSILDDFARERVEVFSEPSADPIPDDEGPLMD